MILFGIVALTRNITTYSSFSLVSSLAKIILNFYRRPALEAKISSTCWARIKTAGRLQEEWFRFPSQMIAELNDSSLYWANTLPANTLNKLVIKFLVSKYLRKLSIWYQSWMSLLERSYSQLPTAWACFYRPDTFDNCSVTFDCVWNQILVNSEIINNLSKKFFYYPEVRIFATSTNRSVCLVTRFPK